MPETRWAESKQKFQNSWSTKTPLVFFVVIKNIKKILRVEDSYHPYYCPPTTTTTTTTTTIIIVSSIMSDNRSTDEVNRELDDIFLLQWMSTLAAHPSRRSRFRHNRLDWNEHVAQLIHERRFANEYRMSPSAHRNLVRLLDPILQRVEWNSRGSEPILVEHIIGLGLRILAGGQMSNIRHIMGLSRAAGYQAFDDFVDAVNSHPDLAINFPKSAEEWREVNDGFKAKSSDQIMEGCVGAIDGYFQRIQTPTKKEVGNVIAYYSGHYESHGVNCQACVRSDLRFMYFGVVSPGSTNDNISYPTASGLRSVVEDLPTGMYCVADAAYTLHENLLIPFTGADRLDGAHDCFNFYLSQLRIRVEMAFGRLTNKFRILKGCVLGSLDRVTSIVMACARLHNYIIKMDGPNDVFAEVVENGEDQEFSIVPHPDAPLGMSYLPVVPNEDWEQFEGISYTRLAIVDYLRNNGIMRPLYNLQRKRDEVFVDDNGESNNNIECNHDLEWDDEYISPS